MNIDDCITAVKGAIEIFDAAKSPSARIFDASTGLHEVIEFLLNQKRLATPILKSLGDVSDLPEELIRELSVQKTDELDDQILTVMRACGGEAGLDQVLVGLYRKFKVIQTRRFIQNKLYRMSKKELIYQIPGQRAAYSLDPQPATEPQYKYDDAYGGPVKPPPGRKPERAELDEEFPF
jgi:hypothetical protein